MTKKHFIRAADMVRAILAGEWTNEPPAWAISWKDVHRMASQPYYVDDVISSNVAHNYTRAVQTAEAFMLLFAYDNPDFDMQRFLIACGLAEKPAKKGQR